MLTKKSQQNAENLSIFKELLLPNLRPNSIDHTSTLL